MVLRQPRPEVSCPRDRHRRGGGVKVKKRSNELKRQLRCYAVLRSVLRTVLRFSTVLNESRDLVLHNAGELHTLLCCASNTLRHAELAGAKVLQAAEARTCPTSCALADERL